MGLLVNANPWGELPDAAPFVLPVDLAVVREWNARVKQRQLRIRDDLLPDPMLGDALNASLIVLALNPSWEGTDAEDHVRPEISGRMRLALAVAEPFFWLQEGLEHTEGGRWWRSHLRPLIEMTSLEAVRDHVAVGQLHQYHSKASTPELRPPSGRHNLEVVRKGMAKGTPVIALAGAAQWRKADPAFRTAKIHEPNSSQAMVLSPKNYPEAFDLAVDAIAAAAG